MSFVTDSRQRRPPFAARRRRARRARVAARVRAEQGRDPHRPRLQQDRRRSKPMRKQTETGFMMGLEYATGGTMEVDGRKIEVIVKDDQLKPDIGKALLAEAYGDDKVDIAVGTTVVRRRARDAAGRRGVQEDPDRRAGGRRLDHRRQVEPLHLPHRRATRSQDALAAAVDARQGRECRSPRSRRTTPSAATASQAFKEALAPSAARPRSCTRNTRRRRPPTSPRRRQRLFDALKDKPGRKIIVIVWAGAPIRCPSSPDLKPERYGIEIAPGGNILPVMAG